VLRLSPRWNARTAGSFIENYNEYTTSVSPNGNGHSGYGYITKASVNADGYLYIAGCLAGAAGAAGTAILSDGASAWISVPTGGGIMGVITGWLSGLLEDPCED
jgi:hypothetical protein